MRTAISFLTGMAFICMLFGIIQYTKSTLKQDPVHVSVDTVSYPGYHPENRLILLKTIQRDTSLTRIDWWVLYHNEKSGYRNDVIRTRDIDLVTDSLNKVAEGMIRLYDKIK